MRRRIRAFMTQVRAIQVTTRHHPMVPYSYIPDNLAFSQDACLVNDCWHSAPPTHIRDTHVDLLTCG